MDDDAETRDDRHLLWHSYLGDLHRLIDQASLQKQQLARHAGVNPSTVGRWLRSPTPVAWNRLEQIIDACIEHARAHELPLTPAHFADRSHWRNTFPGEVPGLPRGAQLPSTPLGDAVPAAPGVRPMRPLPDITLVASPLFAMFVVALVATVTTFSLCTTMTFTGSSGPSVVTSAPTPAISALTYHPGLLERGEAPLAADRDSPRPTLSPSESRTPTDNPSGPSCDTLQPPRGLTYVIIACTPVAVTALLCPETVTPPGPAAEVAAPDPATSTSCLLLRFAPASAR